MKEQLNQLVVIAIVLSFLIAGCSSGAAPIPPTQPPPTATPPTPTPPVQGKDPESVLKVITEALNRKDVEAATALLADDVVQTLVPASSGSGIYKGKEAMRARFQEVVAGNPIHKLTNCQTSGDKVTCAATYSDDSTKPLGFDLEFKVDAVVQNGLLKTVTWTLTDASLAKMQAAMAEAQKKSPESVLKAITEALNRKDVDGATALLAEDVSQTLIPAPSGTGIYKGKEVMRARFKEVVAGNAVHKFGKCETSGDQVTCAVTYSDDSTKPLGFDLEFTVEAVVQNGLLKTVTWTMTGASLAKMQAAMAPTAKPTAALSPEVLATKAEDVIGVWYAKLRDLMGSTTEAHLEFTAKGTYTIIGISGDAKGVPIDHGKFKIEGGQLKFESDGGCVDVQGKSIIPCIGVYQIYVAKQGDKPVLLRFVVVEDKAPDRKLAFDKLKLPRVEP
jgi:ketosteroid isomerase-like protein